MISNFLHALAHRLDPTPCTCSVNAYMHGWRTRRDAELREAAQPRSPDELDAAFRRLIADGEWTDWAV